MATQQQLDQAAALRKQYEQGQITKQQIQQGGVGLLNNSASIPNINLGLLGKFGSAASQANTATPGFIEQRNNQIISGLGAGATDVNTVKNYLTNQQGFSGASAADQQNTINNITRQAAQTATPQNPARSIDIGQGELQYDSANPQDYIFKMNAKSAFTKPTQNELYQYQLAQAEINKQKTASQEDPYAKMITDKQAEKDALKAQLQSENDIALNAYKQQLEAQYGSMKSEALAGGQREQQAAQSATSFSGFGRSTFNADQQVEIQKRTDAAVNALEQSKQAEIQKRQMELQGLSGQALEGINKQISDLKGASFQLQQEAIKNAADISAKGGADFTGTLNNLMTAATKSGLQLDEKGFTQAATAMQGMTPQQQSDYLKNFGPEEQLMLQGLAKATPAKTVTLGSGKNAREMQYNPQTGKYDIPVGGGSMGGGSGGSGGGGMGGIGGVKGVAGVEGQQYKSLLNEKQQKTVASTPEAKKLSSLNNLNGKLDYYNTLVDKYGFEAYGKGKTSLDAAYADLKIAYKEAANLGALTGPDVELLQEAVKLSSGGARKYLSYVVGGGKEGVIESIRTTKEIMQREIDKNADTLLSRYPGYENDIYLNTLIKGGASTRKTGGGDTYKEGQTATNKQTGEKMIYQGGQWKPVKSQPTQFGIGGPRFGF